LQKMRRFARYWDLVANSGNFVESHALLWSTGPSESPFWNFMSWSEWLHTKAGRTDSIALVRLMEFLFDYLTAERNVEKDLVAGALYRDYRRGGRHDKPAFLKEFLAKENPGPSPRPKPYGLPKRQARHLV
jgi:hypothetical protein